MLVDAALQKVDDLREVDVCIVGSGPAGMTLARELTRSRLRICMLESGGRQVARQTQDLNVASVASEQGYGAQPLRDGRRRQLGGTANLWNHEMRGQPARYIRYVALDALDFEKREWIPDSGWPFSKSELEPFYQRAREFCGLKPVSEPPRPGADLSRSAWETERLESILSHFGSASTFLQTHRRELEQNAETLVVLHAALLGLQLDPLSRAITSARAGTLDGRQFTVRAKIFVLAAGAIENARLLLLQEAAQSGGLGNQHGMVGRCFMDHPSITLGTLRPFSKNVFSRAGFYDQHDVDGQPIMGKLHIREAVQRREQMLNLCAVLVPHFRNLRTNAAAVLKQFLLKGPRFLFAQHAAEHCYSTQPSNHAVLPLRQRLLEGYYSECYCGWSQLSNLAERFGEFGVRSLVEQSPDRSNRIVLDEKTDAFGQRQTQVHWRWNEVDLRSIRRAQQIFAEDFRDAGIGKFSPVPEAGGAVPRVFYSPHHFMGTTRMHENPRNGVVDANGRVHEVANLFVSGSSVFPTGGFANPTLTLTALAIRLADHLRDELADRSAVQTPASRLEVAEKREAGSPSQVCA